MSFSFRTDAKIDEYFKDIPKKQRSKEIRNIIHFYLDYKEEIDNIKQLLVDMQKMMMCTTQGISTIQEQIDLLKNTNFPTNNVSENIITEQKDVINDTENSNKSSKNELTPSQLQWLDAGFGL